MSQWYYAHDGEQKGPVPVSELQRLAAAGQFDPEKDLVWQDGMPDWKPASTIPELSALASAGAPAPGAAPAVGPQTPAAAPTTQTANPYAAPQSNPIQPSAAGGPLPFVKPANYGLMVTLLVIGFVAFFGGAMMLAFETESTTASSPTPEDIPVVGLSILGLGSIPLIIGSIMSVIYLYRAWLLLQPHTTVCTPGKAVGFLFIPLFNLYWIFVAYWRWSQEWNRIVASSPNHPGAPRAAEGLFLTYAVLNVCGLIPFIGSLVSFVSIVFFLVIMKTVCNAVNYAAQGQSNAA